MKKSDEALFEAQRQAEIYRQKLESGEIRLLPERTVPPPKQKDEWKSFVP